jgi:hypothetical protein
MPDPSETDLERFYRLAFELTNADIDLDPLVDEALAALVATTRATFGYLELRLRETTFVRGHCRQGRDNRDLLPLVSRDIRSRVAAERRSVVVNAGPFLLCVPIWNGDPRGWIYLEGRARFSELDLRRVEVLARTLGIVWFRLGRTERLPLAQELALLRERRIREAVRRHFGNVSRASRELPASRSRIYRVLRSGSK